MDARGFGEQHVSCYRLVSAFMAARQPLVILLCGAPWTGEQGWADVRTHTRIGAGALKRVCVQ